MFTDVSTKTHHTAIHPRSFTLALYRPTAARLATLIGEQSDAKPLQRMCNLDKLLATSWYIYSTLLISKQVTTPYLVPLDATRMLGCKSVYRIPMFRMFNSTHYRLIQNYTVSQKTTLFWFTVSSTLIKDLFITESIDNKWPPMTLVSFVILMSV